MLRSADPHMTPDRDAQDSAHLPSPRAAFVAALVFLAVALLLLPWEDVLLLACNEAFQSSAPFWEFVENWTPLLLLATAIPLGAWLLFRARTRAFRTRGLILLAVPLLAISAGEALKSAIARPRPMSEELGLVARGLATADPLVDCRSFPSGHVITTTAVFASLVILFSRRRAARWLLLGIPLLMLDRLALARHFPSDVLCGAALACAVTAFALRVLRHGVAPVAARWRPAFGLLLVLALGFAVAKPVRVVDGSGEELDGFASGARWERVLAEPVLGPALALARSATPRALAEAALPLLALALVVVLLLPARNWRCRFLRGALLLAWAGLVAGAVVLGLAPGDRWHSTERGLFLDLHTHGGDPVDGRADARELVGALAARGIDVVGLTHHDAVAPAFSPSAGVVVLEALEWSAGVAHTGGVMPHFLCFGERVALEDAARSATGFAARTALSTADLLAEVRALKERGLVVVVAHDAATRSAWKPGGRLAGLPSRADYVAAGVDGFEVRHRAVPGSKAEKQDAESLFALCKKHSLLGLGASDSHGPVRGSPCVTFFPGEFSPELAARQGEVLQRLREHGAHTALLVAAPTDGLRGGTLLPVEIAWDYLRSMPGTARLAWLGWAVLVTLLLSRTQATACARTDAAGAPSAR